MTLLLTPGDVAQIVRTQGIAGALRRLTPAQPATRTRA